MFFEWKAEYQIGHEHIDSQHKSLVNLVNRFYEAAQNDSVNSGALFDQLLEYTRFHFKDEELLMESLKYPDLDIHRRTHQALIERVLELRHQYSAKNSKLTQRSSPSSKCGSSCISKRLTKKIVQSI